MRMNMNIDSTCMSPIKDMVIVHRPTAFLYAMFIC